MGSDDIVIEQSILELDSEQDSLSALTTIITNYSANH